MEAQTNKKLAAALYYAEHFRWSVIPLRPGDKKPLIAWDRYKTERASVEQIKTWWSKWPEANIGIVTGKISGFVVIDIDNEDGFKAIAIYLPEGFTTPEQTTPKGGSHLLCKHPMTFELPNNARLIPGCDFRGDGGYIVVSPSVNGNGKGWVWVNGKKPSQIPFAELPEAYLKAITQPKKEEPKDIPGVMFTEGRRNEDLFHVGNCMMKGGAKQHEVSQTLERLAISCGYPESDVRATVESAVKRAEKKERNVTSEIRNYVAMTEGYFTLEEIYRSIGLNDREEKATARKALERLVKDNEIERHSQRDGIFRRIDEDAPLIDYKNASEETIPVNYPFAIHELVNTYPGNTITVAGTMNAGKTAFLLNFVAMNMLAFRIKYFSSEMGPSEFKVRLSKFENVPFDDWNFEARERSGISQM